MRFIMCLCVVWPLSVGAQDLFVAVGGNDSTGDGSIGNPFATITTALDNAVDGALIEVGPGVYTGRVRLRGEFSQGVTVRANPRYGAQLRNAGTVVTCYTGQGITLEGFEIAHSGAGAEALVIQIQDLRGTIAGGDDKVERIVLRDNVLHDSFNNDILKINNGAGDITVEGNLFYNQAGSDEHIDINSVTNIVVQDNIFMNDFAGSGRVNGNNTSSYIVIKDSNGADDANLGSRDIVVQRNIFLNWEGSTGSNFVLCGEDGMSYFEAIGVRIESNLFLGNSGNVMRAAFGVKGCKDIFFINNTVSGDLPALAYAMRLNQEGANLPVENVVAVNNIWSDATGTMGAGNGGSNDFSDTPVGEVASFELDTNLYWNGGVPIPVDESEVVNITDDDNAITGDPLLVAPNAVTLPRWVEGANMFADGSSSIREAFVALATTFGAPGNPGPAIETGRGDIAPASDLLGNPRDGMPDIGAIEASLGGPLFADVDQSGFVNAVDIQLVINAVLGVTTNANADVNNDGATNAIDIQLVINAVLGL